ncbi:hypothetical protein KGF57_001405 [Candida theae]|uniref:Uncharacterized protein n=1 Tax=Candida theae TaxID=1198502 RepID=A0AAD5FZQ1_9ASCO|nr:uncharacterized protein KGF57_001405 [Candida theae]KAI5962753.1 hypothetical protein KGF57_001405 [Candida theae]
MLDEYNEKLAGVQECVNHLTCNTAINVASYTSLLRGYHRRGVDGDRNLGVFSDYPTYEEAAAAALNDHGNIPDVGHMDGVEGGYNTSPSVFWWQRHRLGG